jgi:hypothetical protein
MVPERRYGLNGEITEYIVNLIQQSYLFIEPWFEFSIIHLKSAVIVVEYDVK